MLVCLTEFSSSASVFKLCLLLILFIALLYGAHIFTKWFARSGMAGEKGKNIQLVETKQLAPGKTIVIAKIGSKYVSFLMLKDTATLLTELTEDELEPVMPEAAGNVSFIEVFKNMKDVHRKQTKK